MGLGKRTPPRDNLPFSVWKAVFLQESAPWHMGRISVKLTFFFFFLFGAVPTAYGSSQARGQIRAMAVAYTTATATWDPIHVCNLQLATTPNP